MYSRMLIPRWAASILSSRCRAASSSIVSRARSDVLALAPRGRSFVASNASSFRFAHLRGAWRAYRNVPEAASRGVSPSGDSGMRAFAGFSRRLRARVSGPGQERASETVR